MGTKSGRNFGFTIVELLIVIVIIAVLSTLVITTYSGIQLKAQTSRRISDIRSIAKSLELYKIQTGEYPAAQSNTAGGWESSAINPDNFLSALKSSEVTNQVPVDPVNTVDFGSSSTPHQTTSYMYYRYSAGYLDCPVSRGAFYVLVSAVQGSTPHPDSPGFSCGNYNLSALFYVIGSTTN